MDATGSSAWDYALFVVLTLLSLGTGLYLSLRRRGRLRTKDEAFLGSRSIHALPLAVSMVASNVTAVGMVAFVAHYYVHGFHTMWHIPTFVPLEAVIVYLFLPVMYELKITSVFEYLRMRYGNGVGVASSVIYFVLSQSIGGAAIYSAALSMATIFEITPAASSVILGVAGTTYTALGGLRSVVWADAVQALIMTASPLIIIFKVIYDAAHSAAPLRPLADMNATAYFLRTDIDFTTDETIWASSLAAFPNQLMRLGLDQMITQRFLAARSLHDARIVAFAGAALVGFFYSLNGVTALALLYWFRDCDPVLSGFISRHDQIVPYYVNKSAGAIQGLRGLFLAGIASASISTVSSIVNSHAAVLYIDIVSLKFRVDEERTMLVTTSLAAASGTIMTLVALLVPYVSSAARFFIALSSAASGPFSGIMILAFLFPWANAKGTATAALGVFVVQIWQTAGRFFSRLAPPRMQYGLDRCPANSTTLGEVAPPRNVKVSEVFPMYRVSPFWCCLVAAFSTVLLGLALSLVFDRRNGDNGNALRLSSPLALKFWRRIGLLRRFAKEDEPAEAKDQDHKALRLELQPLNDDRDGLCGAPEATCDDGPTLSLSPHQV
ncbi:putative sodium-dependent multivitamin transporter isoform X2 [Dermacentor albipictus]|uniref:putative sodium-dependent multivitamin transporter isoform X2 n=1 Tax=Dermacentor albipictus TaxID=60249 RepID=UPI0038FC1FEC